MHWLYVCRFTFECRLECEGIPRIEWFKDGMPLTSPDYHTSYRDGLCTLTIDEVFSEDTARYACRAITSVGSDETVGSLRVKGTPIVICSLIYFHAKLSLTLFSLSIIT